MAATAGPAATWTSEHPFLRVSPEWLAANLERNDVKVLDASWYLPVMGRDAAEDFSQARIPGSVRFDIDAVADASSDLPHMLPPPAVFAAAAAAVPVTATDTVVVYDGLGTFSSPRAWWTWTMFGHERVAILDGGLPAWQAAGLPVDTTSPSDHAAQGVSQAAAAPQAGDRPYPAEPRGEQVKSLAQVQEAVASGDVQIVDARPAGRFAGRDPEPRASLKSGHMPGALSVPFMSLLEGGAPAGRFLSPDALAAKFQDAGVDTSKPILCTCGSGATAATLVHALAQIGATQVSLYDGSWMEWAATEGSEIVSDE